MTSSKKQLNNYILLPLLVLSALLVTRCSSYSSFSDKRINLPAYWVKLDELNSTMPKGIEFFRTIKDYSVPNKNEVRKVNAYAVIFNPKQVVFKPTYSKEKKSPQLFIKDEPGKVLACVNAGFFGNVPYSLLQYNNIVFAHNTTNVTRQTKDGQSYIYHPTRAAFGISSNARPDVAWVYSFGDTVYSFNRPMPNHLNTTPLPSPKKANGKIWDVSAAVGGAPMLIKNGEIELSTEEELADLDNQKPRARTAIGYLKDGKVIIIVIEGENKGVSDGFTLKELAHFMKDMGCVGAVNLDGGGSSVFFIEDELMIRPSSSAKEREMPGVILIKAKN